MVRAGARQAADTADTALTPLTRSSALRLPPAEWLAETFVKHLGRLLVSRKPPESNKVVARYRGAAKAHGASQRFQRSVSGVSGAGL